MSIAFTFPGQGSQAVGMGKDLAGAFPEARRVFQEVDDALGENLSKLIWEGPEETLTLTANAQPALMAVSLAAVRALEARGFSLRTRRSHSSPAIRLANIPPLPPPGSCPSLMPPGCCAFAAMPCRRRCRPARARWRRSSGSSRQMSMRLAAQAARTSGKVCQIANDNGGGQLVISGAREAVELAARLCTEQGAKAGADAAGFRSFSFCADGARRRRDA
jgi:[acyl-carrier-protein] S-malonyltransferase